MNTRRAHAKSRHGCLTCKRRKVKCDEVRPVCSNCRQRGQSCDYDTQSPYIWASNGLHNRAEYSERGSGGSTGPETLSSSKSSLNPINRLSVNHSVDRPAPSLNMKQLELIVQWQRHTYKLFARNETEHIWQTLIVEEALRVPMLMHGILGVSALHIAFCREGEEKTFWADLATAHNDEALRSFMDKLFHLDSSNAKAMLGVASSVVAHAFGIPIVNASHIEKPSLDALISVFFLCRGVHDIISATSLNLKNSNFATLLVVSSPTKAAPSIVNESISHLEAMNTALETNIGHDFATYAKTIDVLKDISRRIGSHPYFMSAAGELPIRIPKNYIDYIQGRHPFSLVILAHYCALLHMSHGSLFIQPWGSYVLRDICACLDNNWKCHISWPLHQVFEEDEAV